MLRGIVHRKETLFNAVEHNDRLSMNATVAAGATPAAAPITCNAFLYNALGQAGLVGLTSATLATTAVDLPGRGSNNRREVQRYVIGAEGDFDAFGKPARWDVYGQYGRAKLHEQLTNIQQTVRRNNALQAVLHRRQCEQSCCGLDPVPDQRQRKRSRR